MEWRETLDRCGRYGDFQGVSFTKELLDDDILSQVDPNWLDRELTTAMDCRSPVEVTLASVAATMAKFHRDEMPTAVVMTKDHLFEIEQLNWPNSNRVPMETFSGLTIYTVNDDGEIMRKIADLAASGIKAIKP